MNDLTNVDIDNLNGCHLLQDGEMISSDDGKWIKMWFFCDFRVLFDLLILF